MDDAIVLNYEISGEDFTRAGEASSDVLAFSKDHSILLTGLCNPQVIRTAEMLDIVCVIFVRGKKPDEMTLQMAEDSGLVVLATGHRMFSACGMLYKAGLGGGAA